MSDPEHGWRWYAYLAGRCLANLPRAVRNPAPVVDALINLEREAAWTAELSGFDRIGSLTLAERLFLHWLCTHVPIRTAFEIGTGHGWTTRLLAEYAKEVYTLDLPGRADVSCRHPYVTCLAGDSMTFDFSPYEGRMDLVFVDGGHDRRTVEHDSAVAERLRTPRGVIVWHDCNIQHRDVWAFLRDLRTRIPIVRVENTRFAVKLGNGLLEALP